MNQVGQPVRIIGGGLQQVLYPEPDVSGEIPDLDYIDGNRLASKFLYGSRQRVIRSDLVVPVRRDDKEIAESGTDFEVTEKFQRSSVGPLPVVDEKNNRVLGLADNAKHISDQAGKTIARL